MFHRHTLCCAHLVSVLLNSSSSHVVTVLACTTSFLIVIFTWLCNLCMVGTYNLAAGRTLGSALTVSHRKLHKLTFETFFLFAPICRVTATVAILASLLCFHITRAQRIKLTGHSGDTLESFNALLSLYGEF